MVKFIVRAIITKEIEDSNKNKFYVNDKVKFTLIMSGKIFKCEGTILEIYEESFKLIKVKIDNEYWSESLPLIARYDDIKNSTIIKL